MKLTRSVSPRRAAAILAASIIAAVVTVPTVSSGAGTPTTTSTIPTTTILEPEDAGAAGYDRDSAFDDLTSDDFGFTDEQANCILDKVEAQGLEDVVVEDDIDNVDQADIEAVTDIFAECTLGDLEPEPGGALPDAEAAAADAVAGEPTFTG